MKIYNELMKILNGVLNPPLSMINVILPCNLKSILGIRCPDIEKIDGVMKFDRCYIVLVEDLGPIPRIISYDLDDKSNMEAMIVADYCIINEIEPLYYVNLCRAILSLMPYYGTDEYMKLVLSFMPIIATLDKIMDLKKYGNFVINYDDFGIFGKLKMITEFDSFSNLLDYGELYKYREELQELTKKYPYIHYGSIVSPIFFFTEDMFFGKQPVKEGLNYAYTSRV